MARVVLEDVTVRIPIYDANARSLKHSVLRFGTGGAIRQDSRTVVVQALDGISISLDKGDRVGLIGRNGAGKTTLLRVLAGIYEPSIGKVLVEGRVASLFDFTSGINPELSGYENIYLRGLLIGLSRREIRERVQEVAEFSELGEFLNLPVRTYSNGMKLRLGFAISTAVSPEILLLDEAIGAGDAAFVDKAKRRMDELISDSNILVLATHSPAAIRDFCNRAAWLERGRLRMFGAVDEVLEQYGDRPGSA